MIAMTKTNYAVRQWLELIRLHCFLATQEARRQQRPYTPLAFLTSSYP